MRERQGGQPLTLQALRPAEPRTLVFASLEQAAQAWRQGRNVFLVRTPEELLSLERGLDTHCFQGPPGLILQERVDLPGRDARVVVGNQLDTFWRMAPSEDAFFTSLSQGGQVDRDGWLEEMARAVALVRRLQDVAGLDMAGVDVLVPEGAPPMLLEIIVYFGRNAHGGTEGLRQVHLQAVRE